MVRMSARQSKPARGAIFAIGLVGLSSGDPVCGQPAAIPPEVAAKVRALGPVLNDEVRSSARSLYAPLQPKIGSDILVSSDITYGPDERHKLDLLAPASKPAAPIPVVIYVHGGAYVRGDKSLPDTPFFQNIAAFWVRHNMIGVNMTYRLAPKHQWPAGAQDVGTVLKWVRDNIDRYGGDPRRIVLMGHSAGASHIAGYLFHKEMWPSGSDGVIGAILLSGGYDPESGQTEGRRAYYGQDESLYAERSPIRHIGSRVVPIFIGFAEYDPPRFQLEAVGLFRALCQRDNRCPPLKQLRGHNHVTQVHHIGTTDEALTADLLAFIHGLK
jgi:acetyl esterase/lipase